MKTAHAPPSQDHIRWLPARIVLSVRIKNAFEFVHRITLLLSIRNLPEMLSGAMRISAIVFVTKKI